METAERQALVEQLQSCRDQVVAEASGLTDAQAAFKSAPDRWSIADCVEHIAVVEKGFYRFLTTTYKIGGAPPASRTGDEFRKRMADRTVRGQAPEPTRPTGRYGSLAGSLERFRGSRNETIAYAGSCRDDLHARTVSHPLFGEITCHQGLVFLVDHALRHLDQIREIKAAPGYPA